MHNPENLQAIFFDFDGVIVDSCTVKRDAFRTLFNDYPSEIIEQVLEYHRQHGGISRVEKIRWAHRELIKTPLTEKELAQWAERYSTLVTDAVVEVPYLNGVVDFLEYCQRVRTDSPLFIVSGTPQPELQEVVKRRGINEYFAEVLGSPTLKPEHIRNQLEKYQLTPSRCIFIGDASTDYDAAMATGLSFVGIQGEVEFPPNISVLPDCHNLQQTLEMFGGW